MTSHDRGRYAPMAVFAVALLMLGAIGAVAFVSEDSSAIQTDTAYVGTYYSKTFTETIEEANGDNIDEVWNGSAGSVYCGSKQAWSGSSSYLGLSGTLSVKTTGSGSTSKIIATLTVTGTPTATGTAYINGDVKYSVSGDGDVIDSASALITAKITIEAAKTTPVTSVSISGSSSVTKGSTITLTATTSPTTATDRHVTWTITSGSSYATIQSSSDTTTGGKCVLKGVSAGSVTVKATASDGSGKYATKTITVSNPSYNYYLNFDMNGGTGGPSDMSKTASDKTSNLAFTIPSTTPTRSGYTFLGWSTSSTATSASYQPGGTIYVDYNDKTLYAVWEQTKQYYYAYLYYNANSGSGAPSTQSDSIYAASASGSKSFTISSTQPTRSGYDFLGWSTSSTATSASYQPGSSISVTYGSSKTLYAVWQLKSYTSTLYFDANNGSGAPSTMSDTHTATSAYTFTIPTTKPTRSGYVFLGWSESSTASSASYQPGGTISVSYNGSKTLYAVWQTAQLDITSEPATKSLKMGQSWSYAPTTNIDGCTVTVSGADWLSVSNGTISGTPTFSGSYSVTVTVSKTGYTSDIQSFTLKVYSTLGFNSDPGASGVFAYAE